MKYVLAHMVHSGGEGKQTKHTHTGVGGTCTSLKRHVGGLRGRVVKVDDLRSQVPHRCRFDPHSGRNLSCDEAIQLAYGRSVVLSRCPLVPEIMPGGASGVFLHQ
jgi:hypothetical protein